MISTEFEQLLKASFPRSLASAMEERFPGQVVEVNEVETEIDKNMKQVIVLTISGHLFRIFVALIFTKEGQLEELVRQALSSSSTELDDSAFYDYFMEVGNVLSGSIKRDIQKAIPSLGMSTPNLLYVESFKYINELKIDHQGAYVVTKDQSPLYYVNYYLGEYGKIECEHVIEREDEVDSGELEFF